MSLVKGISVLKRLGVTKLENKNKGFTLIELLVVIAIIGLLASVVLLALNSARAKARNAKRLADVRQIASALELYFNDKSAYPTAPSAGVLSNTTAPGLSPGYIGLIPTAPTPQDGQCGSAAGPGNNNYWYEATPNTGASYTLTFCLGEATGGYAAGSRVLTPAGIQ